MARKLSPLQQRYFGKGHKAIRGRKSHRSLRSGGRGGKRSKKVDTAVQEQTEGEM